MAYDCLIEEPMPIELINTPLGVEMNKVDFSAVAPQNLVKGNYTIINVVMYVKSFRYIVVVLLL